MKTSFILSAALAIHAAIVAHEADIESLDRAIGDGDHYINVKRGSEAIASMYNELLPLPPVRYCKKLALSCSAPLAVLLGHCLLAFLWVWRVMIKSITQK